MDKNKKSPILDRPLRHAGQSLDEKISDLLHGKLNDYLIIGTMPVMLAALEWYRWHAQQPYAPIHYTVIAIVVLVFAIFRSMGVTKQIRLLKLGRDGERAVGQFLESLRAQGCKVFHDIIGNGFNIDHIIISPHGIFTIETKTFSKPAKGKACIQNLGQSLVINGGYSSSQILDQAKAEAHWLKSLLNDMSGKEMPIKPVVVFPGWFIESKTKCNDIWVLNPKALPTFIANSPVVLSEEDVNSTAFWLSRYIRDCEKRH